ncbi:MAG: hypothetical protein ACRC2R_20565 [Xenococcaceae cyanobacterium]
MQFTLKLSPSGIAKRLLLLVLLLAVLSIAVQMSKYVFNYRSDWMNAINLDREMNFPSWFSTLMLAFCACLLRVIAAGEKNQAPGNAREMLGDRRRWLLLSNIFVFLAADELFSIHEILIIPKLATRLNLPNFLAQIWVIPGAILVVFFAKYYWAFLNRLPKQSRLHFFLAAALYIGGALVMEMVGSAYSKLYGQQNLIYALLATLEEMMEMVGVVVFVYGLLSYLENSNEDIQLYLKFDK